MLQFPLSHAALRMHADAYVPHGMRVHKAPSYIHTHISSCPMLIFVSSHSHHAQDLELQKNTHHNQVHVAVSTDVPPSNTRIFRATSDRRKTGRQTLSWGSVDVRMISPHKHEEHQTCDGTPSSGGEQVANAQTGDFVAAAAFQGSKPGYVFKNGQNGLGYYMDCPPASAISRAGASGGAAHCEDPEARAPSAEVTPCLCGTLWHTCPLIRLSRSHGIYVCVYQRIAMSSLSPPPLPPALLPPPYLLSPARVLALCDTRTHWSRGRKRTGALSR